MQSFFIILALALIFSLLTYYLELKMKNSSWLGTLESKKISDYFYKGKHSNIYILHILKDNGEKMTYNVDETVYLNIQVGERVTKEKGQYYPTRLI